MGNTENLRDVERIAEEAKQDFGEAVDRFVASFKQNTSDPDHFMTIDDLESYWSRLNDETRKIFIDMTSRAVSSIDEGGIIERKKASTAPKE